MFLEQSYSRDKTYHWNNDLLNHAVEKEMWYFIYDKHIEVVFWLNNTQMSKGIAENKYSFSAMFTDEQYLVAKSSLHVTISLYQFWISLCYLIFLKSKFWTLAFHASFKQQRWQNNVKTLQNQHRGCVQQYFLQHYNYQHQLMCSLYCTTPHATR